MTYPKITSDDDRADQGSAEECAASFATRMEGSTPSGFLPPLPPIDYTEASALAHEERKRWAEPADDPENPVLSRDQISIITGRILHVPADRPEIREDVHRLNAYIEYLERLRCNECGASLGHHSYEGKTFCGSCAAVPESEPELQARADADAEPYVIDTVGALGEAATWARRWATERQRADGLAAELERIDALHAPYIDEHGINRCRGCIAGYDPRTGRLTHCKCPCPTARARGGELPLL